MEVEFTKVHTLYLMLEQEKKNLEKLRENESQNGNEISRAEANIRTLQEQLKQSTGDVSSENDLIIFLVIGECGLMESNSNNVEKINFYCFVTVWSLDENVLVALMSKSLTSLPHHVPHIFKTKI